MPQPQFLADSFYAELMNRVSTVEEMEGGLQTWASSVNSRLDPLAAADLITRCGTMEANIAALQSGKYDKPLGNVSQYLRGDGSIATFPAIPAQYTDEMAQDAVGGILSAEFVYDDAGNAIRLRDYQMLTPTFSGSTTATLLSASRKAQVSYAYDASVNITLLAGQFITATLSYADNAAMSSNVVVVDSASTGNSGVLGLNQTNTLRLGGIIPAGKYRRVTFTSTGSPHASGIPFSAEFFSCVPPDKQKNRCQGGNG